MIMEDAEVEIQKKLSELRVPNQMIKTACENLPVGTRALMVYGSYGRGDFQEDSDLDLLALVPSQIRGSSINLVSYSCYTEQQLKTGTGTLFCDHLRRDGRIVFDPENRFDSILRNMKHVDPDELLNRIKRLSCVLDVNKSELERSLSGLCREARYLLRSALYCKAIQEGKPCFSVRELAKLHNDPQLTTILASRPKYEPTADTFYELRAHLEAVIGPLPNNPFQSLDNLIQNSFDKKDEDLYSVGILARGHSSPKDPYEEISKVLL